MSDADIDKEAMNYGAAIAKLLAGNSGPTMRKASRKARAKKIISETDRRHLKRTGRTEQWNIRCRGGLKEQFDELANARGVSMAALLEEILEAFIAGEANPVKNGGGS